MRRMAADELVDIGTRIFVAAGAPEPIARRVADSLVLSNLMGVDSHGIMRVPQYLRGIDAGSIVPDAQPKILREDGAVVLMDGHRAFGQIAAEQAMRVAVDKAKQSRVGIVSFAHVLHIGRLGEWASLAAKEGLFGLVLANGGSPGGLVAPFGSRQRALGTNPIAFAMPAGSNPPVVADFSTAVVAEGRVHLAFQKGEEIPTDWVIDRAGVPTTNPADLYDGGALLTFGGHKGYGLSLMVEVLGGILSGANTPIFQECRGMENGVFMLALDIAFFRPVEEYGVAASTLFTAIQHTLPAEGTEEVLLPGEPELRCRAERERNGIAVAEGTWAMIQEAAAKVGVVI